MRKKDRIIQKDYRVRRLVLNDVEETKNLFFSLIEETYPEPNKQAYFKIKYTNRKIEKIINREEGIALGVFHKQKFVGFLFGWATDGVGSIHWIGVKKKHRLHGAASRLIRYAVRIFRKRNCYKVETFVHPRSRASVKLLRKHSFEIRHHIDKDIFGTELFYMMKLLRKPRKSEMVRKVVLIGTAGQGIRLMSQLLATILTRLGKEVVYNMKYGPSVRAGHCEAQIIYSDDPILVPVVDIANLLVELSKEENAILRFKAKKIIIEEEAYKEIKLSEKVFSNNISAHVSFEDISRQEFNSPLYTNMLALGYVLRKIGINIEKVNFESELPRRFLKQNLEAIEYGYTTLET